MVCPSPSHIPVVLGLLACGALVACGGGGGGGSGVAPAARIASSDLEIATNATTADLVIALADLPSPPPALLQVAIELPAALAIAPSDPLTRLQTTPTLEGSRDGSRYRVVCGDDRNPTAAPLSNGELFSLRVIVTSPRQPGSHEIVLRDSILARTDGSAAATDSAPLTVTVNVR